MLSHRVTEIEHLAHTIYVTNKNWIRFRLNWRMLRRGFKMALILRLLSHSDELNRFKSNFTTHMLIYKNELD